MTLEILNPYTRKIDRTFTKKLFEHSSWTTMDANGKPSIVINPADMQDANDYIVMAMTGATQNDIDTMSPEEFDAILSKINKMKESGSNATSEPAKKIPKSS